jgi:antitoxin (DNA-binding transcriptional repressor) of toxin-antitoxin stability system
MKYTLSEARKKLSKLLKKACVGEEVVIAGSKELLVRLVPVRDPEGLPWVKRNRVPGALRGKIFSTPDAFAPLTGQELRT